MTRKFFGATGRNIPGDGILRSLRRDNPYILQGYHRLDDIQTFTKENI
jgi:hypothetical protein